MDNSGILEKSARNVWNLCSTRGIKLAAAESCTGGFLADSLVSIPGASSFFLGSAVCYCDEAKNGILGVPKEILDKFYAESSETCAAMLDGALRIFPNADAAIATTGFLDSSTGSKPKSLGGSVFIGTALRLSLADSSLKDFANLPVCHIKNSDFLCGAKTGVSVMPRHSEESGGFFKICAEIKLNVSAPRLFNMRAAAATALELFAFALGGL